jgi:pilus assembly protein CpaF
MAGVEQKRQQFKRDTAPFEKELAFMTPIQSRAVLVSQAGACNDLDERELGFQKLKVSIHEKLVDSLDLSMLADIRQKELESEVQAIAGDICKEHAPGVSDDELQRLLDEIHSEMFGLGPIEVLMEDDTVSDILVNGPYEVYVERFGQLERSEVIFADSDHLVRIIQRVVSRVGRRIDEVSPMVDARLADGSRINAVLPPLAVDHPTLSIRRFGKQPLRISDLVESGSLSPNMAEFLIAAVDARISVLISGGTGAGKTTFLNALTEYIPSDERLITIEDSAELRLSHKHVIRMETRPENTEGAGEVTQRDLVRNSLRMRPDRIIIGEVRGGEALDMLQAMNTGHEGSLTTIHANDSRDALSRLEMMVAMAGFELPIPVVRQYMATGITLVVHLARLKGGVRRAMKISEVVGVENDEILLEDVFGFEQTGVDETSTARGQFYATGYRPACLDRMRASGVRLGDETFDQQCLASL